jgi:hypothetical protein
MTTVVVQPPAVDETVVQGPTLPSVVVRASSPPPVTVIDSPPAEPVVVVQTAQQPVVVVNPALYIGGGGGGGYPPIVYTVNAISSFSRAHTFPYPPDVRLIDTSGYGVETAVEYPDSEHVYISFPTPFTGTIVLA